MQKFITGTIAFIALVGLVSLWCTPALHAQVQSQPPSAGQSTQQSQPRRAVSDKELQSFAKAYVEVQKIQASHQASLIKNAKDHEQMQKIQQEANAEMAKAVEKQGFTPEGYTQILAAVRGDTALTKKASELIQKETAN